MNNVIYNKCYWITTSKHKNKQNINQMRISNFKKFLSSNKRTFNQALRMNGLKIENTTNTDYTYFNRDGVILESIDFEFDKKGGVIVFSTDVNAVDISDNVLLNKLKQIIQSLMNKALVTRKVGKIMKKHDEVFGFTIGKFVTGQYKAEDGSVYDENSTSVEIIGIDSSVLLKEDIASEFKQETVLVKDYQKNSIYLAKND